MLRGVHQAMRMLLTIAFVVGSFVTHAGSVSHAEGGDTGASHLHLNLAEAAMTERAPDDHVERFAPGGKDSSHGAGLCLDAHCCVPAMQAATQDSPRHALERGRLRAAAPSQYAKSIAYGLLKPPRALA